jgi:triacylglycerol esterase/lipase EstA (alpha/beta hydrolase family)
VRRAALILIAAGALLVPASAQAVDFAPVGQAGPALSVPQSDLNASLACTPSVHAATMTPILLVHGTGSDPENNFSWNWEPALNALGIPWCTVALPHHGLGDVQTAGEYVVNAIRAMSADAGRKISIVGHSQGGMIPRWALRFWPDTRSMVDDVIGIAPSNHGTKDAEFTCQGGCPAADWQQSDTANFIQALNSFKETFAGISYTQIYTHNDEIVTPNSDDTGSSSLHTGDGQITNEAVQQICPLDPSDHLALGTTDAVAFALGIDAYNHPGPADPARTQTDNPNLCTTPFMPGVNPANVAANSAAAAADLAANQAAEPNVPREPELRCYVFAGGCPPGTASPAAGRTTGPGKCHRKKRHHGHKRNLKRGCKKKKKHKHHA